MPGDDREPSSDPDRAAVLREAAEDVRGETPESGQVAAMLYRVSDPDEETTPAEIDRNLRTIPQVRERGGRPRADDR